jgi:carbonic anhydrase/SulP family sulfate permease
LIFDLSLGDVFSVRIAGNVASHKVLGSIEYSCAVAGAKLILVMGHTSCGAVKESVELVCHQKTAVEATGCENLDSLVREIQKSVDLKECQNLAEWNADKKQKYFNEIAYKNILHTMNKIRQGSSTIEKLIQEGKVAIVGAMYDISTAEVTFFQSVDSGPPNGNSVAEPLPAKAAPSFWEKYLKSIFSTN